MAPTFLVLEHKTTKNHIWYFYPKNEILDSFILRQMGMNNDTSNYSHEIKNNTDNIIKWLDHDLENGYTVIINHDEHKVQKKLAEKKEKL